MLDETEEGLLIHDTMEGLPAAKSGLEQGDVIIEINGAGPATMDRLRKALGASEITLTIDRDGSEEEVSVQLGGADDGDNRRPRWRARGGEDAERERLRALVEAAAIVRPWASSITWT